MPSAHHSGTAFTGAGTRRGPRRSGSRRGLAWRRRTGDPLGRGHGIGRQRSVGEPDRSPERPNAPQRPGGGQVEPSRSVPQSGPCDGWAPTRRAAATAIASQSMVSGAPVGVRRQVLAEQVGHTPHSALEVSDRRWPQPTHATPRNTSRGWLGTGALSAVPGKAALIDRARRG